jgi:hypothetical protein
MRRLKERLTFANVAASLALFIALGGTSYAAITLPRNSVGANQLRTGSVRSSEIKDRSIGARDLTLGARRFLKGQQGERGPRGPEGPAGSAGTTTTTPGGGTTTTPAGIRLTIRTESGSLTDAPATAIARCDAGQSVTGGGVRIVTDGAADASVSDSFPSDSGTTWTGVVGSDDAGTETFTVYAVCAS